MIEQAIYFGIGCAVAGLLALAFLPVLWARALRLTRQRLQRQIPVSMQEILADRDQLRAGFAVERRKLEQEMQRIQAGKARDMSELGRRSAEAFALSETVAAVQSAAAARESELAEIRRELERSRAQTGALQIALDDSQASRAKLFEDLEALRRAHDELEEGAEQRRLTVAALNTRTMGLEMTIEDGERARAALERQIAALRQPGEASVDGSREYAPPEDLAAARVRIEQLEAALQAAVNDAKEREKGIHLQKSLQAERARGDSRAGQEKVDALQAEVAALRGALAARHAPDVGPIDATGDAQLRASIHEIGLAVARMTSSRRDGLLEGGEPLPAPQRPAAGVTAPSLA